MIKQPAPTPSSRVINRHMARCLSELEDNGYSAECIEIVKRAFCWARDDLGKGDDPINAAELQAQINAERKCAPKRDEELDGIF